MKILKDFFLKISRRRNKNMVYDVKEILKRTIICILVIFVCCEYIIYHVVLSRCYWPTFNNNEEHLFKNDKFIDDTHTVRVLILSDPHLLGSKHGHWFDKLRREWQMKRSFQTAMSYLTPDVVIVLGDIFDEGMICSDEEWEYYVRHFWEIFSHPPHVHFHLVPGNHDIGFHESPGGETYIVNSELAVYLKGKPYIFEMLVKLLYRSHLEKRFRRDFNISGVTLLPLSGNIFIFVNSMAFEQDGCSLCRDAEKDLHTIKNKLQCLHKDQFTLNYLKRKCEIDPMRSDPIIFQHFPLYRSSEINCTGKDGPLFQRQSQLNRGGWEVLSESASDLLMSSIQPRIIFSGHTHHSCHVIHKNKIHEFSVPSFSWRNRNDPSFYMGTINPNAASVKKCWLPEENTVIAMYIFFGISCFFYIIWTCYKHHCLSLNKLRIFQQRETIKMC